VIHELFEDVCISQVRRAICPEDIRLKVPNRSAEKDGTMDRATGWLLFFSKRPNLGVSIGRVVSRCSLLSGEISQIFGMCSICRKRSSLSLPRNSKDSSGKVAITSSSRLHRAPRGARLLYLQCHTLALRTNSGSATDGNLRAGSRIKSRCTFGISFFHIPALVRYLASALGQKRKFARAYPPWPLVSNFIVFVRRYCLPIAAPG
jgi:hypothetical protein